MIFKRLTGHMYRNIHYYSDDNCGTCDGARCETCKTKYYILEDEGKLFNTEKEALELEDEYRVLLNEVRYIGTPKFLIINNMLYGEVYPIHDEEYKDIQIECNKSSKLYNEIFERTLQNLSKYRECVCTNKDSELCGVYGCEDNRCYNEMIQGKRTRKKWYM